MASEGAQGAASQARAASTTVAGNAVNVILGPVITNQGGRDGPGDDDEPERRHQKEKKGGGGEAKLAIIEASNCDSALAQISASI